MNYFTDLLLKTGYGLIDKVSPLFRESSMYLLLHETRWQGLIPDFILRPVIRQLCLQRIKDVDNGGFAANHAAKMEWIDRVKARADIADVPHKANEQHYEVSH